MWNFLFLLLIFKPSLPWTEKHEKSSNHAVTQNFSFLTALKLCRTPPFPLECLVLLEWPVIILYQESPTWASADFFPREGKNFPGGARTYFLPKKTTKKIQEPPPLALPCGRPWSPTVCVSIYPATFLSRIWLPTSKHASSLWQLGQKQKLAQAY
jgi:hypothetical protein